jgi:diaminohydroxyphosphoribosylaminopyrimidine deaminase/5-amino-6-(5-phosphoribosylamino)uracil reductase
MSPFMARAFALARRALGRSNPNPPAGAVVVREGKLVGEGYTQPVGSWHAEIMALRQAGPAARGAALYVTLEPCAHYGRTPPCVDAILAAGVSEVHIAIEDPNPIARGGRERLEAAGVRVLVGEGAEQARALYAPHIKHKTTGLPWVIAKYAMSLDGKIATRTGESRWITGPAAREVAHRLRAQVDAIAVGAGTVLTDDPQLTARPRGRPWPRQPLRVVVDAEGRVPPTAQVFQGPGPALLATRAGLPEGRQEAYRAAGVEVLSLPGDEGRVDLEALLVALGQRETTSLLVEGGGQLLGSFFDRGLVDQVYAFIAPLIIGGTKAVPAVGGLGVAHMEDALRLAQVRVRRIGDDLLVIGTPRPRD